MRIKGKKNRLITATAIFLVVFGIVTQAGIAMVTAGTPYTGSYGNYYLNDVSRPISDGDCGYTTVSKEASFHFEFMSNGETVTYVEERRIKPRYAKSICWGKPEVVCCNHCELLSDDGNRYSMQIFLEDDNGNEYCRKSGYELTREDLQSTGLDFENLATPIRVGLEITLYPGEYCPYCKRHKGDLIIVDGLKWGMTCVDFSSHPQSVPATYGGSAEFTVGLATYRNTLGDSLDFYKWEIMGEEGEWSPVEDGVSSTGTVYEGSDTNHLTVSNISRDLYGSKFRCELKGANYMKAFSLPAGLMLSEYNPVPTLPPSVTTVPAITPAPGSGTEYKPSASSSAYVQPSSSNEIKPAASSSSHSSTSGGGTYKGDIITPAISGTDQKISTTDLISGTSPGTSGKKRPVSSTGRLPAGDDKSASASSSSLSRKSPGANYVMKNGVLYIVDDEDTAVDSGEKNGGEEIRSEESEVVSEYSADDLAIEGNLYSARQEKSFWSTTPGYLVIGVSALLLLILTLFFLFFGVIVCGEVEEHDEVFELCGIRLMQWHKGSWQVNLGCAFDENAVVKLHIGLLFALIFAEWDITGKSKGIYEGETGAPAGRGMLMYRKNIRRSV